MGAVERVYAESPVPLQNLFTTLAGYERNRFRYGQTYWRHLAWLEEFDSWPIERKLAFQQAALGRFVRDSAARSRFYQSLYGGEGASVDSLADLRNLPIVDKEMLRSNIDSVYTIPARRSVEGHTGGTTGKSLVVRFTRDDSMRRMAILDHFKRRVGFENRAMTRATFMGKHIVPPGQRSRAYWRYNHAGRQMLYSTFNLTESNLRFYVDSLIEFRPHAIDGMPSAIAEVAKYIERMEIRLRFRPIAIFPTSETLSRETRELLQRVFRTRVYDQYASSEGAPFVTECAEQTKHVELSSGVFEELDASGGEILVSSFTTSGTPLIRYRIGDSMKFGNIVDCGCGLETPTVEQIYGRSNDFLYRADGAKINSVNFGNMFKNVPNSIIRAQATQETKEEVVLAIVVDASRFSHEHEILLREEFRGKFGNQTRLKLRYVDHIPNERSGKFRAIRNLVDL